ncbi:MAG: tRNA adenosine(34) deaminase TadA [Candidatus Margulisiibacteriota bacterium]
MSNPHTHYMFLAIEEAQRAQADHEVPVGAILVNSNTGEVITAAHNLCLRKNDPTAHAELLAMQQAAQKVDLLHTDLTLYVTLEPCPMCAGAILQCRINRVVYGADDPKAGACGSVVNILQNESMDFQPEIIAGICAEECGELLSGFFKKLRGG